MQATPTTRRVAEGDLAPHRRPTGPAVDDPDYFKCCRYLASAAAAGGINCVNSNNKTALMAACSNKNDVFAWCPVSVAWLVQVDMDCFCPPGCWHKQHHRHPRHPPHHHPHRLSKFIPALNLLPVLGERRCLNGRKMYNNVAVAVVFYVGVAVVAGGGVAREVEPVVVGVAGA